MDKLVCHQDNCKPYRLQQRSITIQKTIAHIKILSLLAFTFKITQRNPARMLSWYFLRSASLSIRINRAGDSNNSVPSETKISFGNRAYLSVSPKPKRSFNSDREIVFQQLGDLSQSQVQFHEHTFYRFRNELDESTLYLENLFLAFLHAHSSGHHKPCHSLSDIYLSSSAFPADLRK